MKSEKKGLERNRTAIICIKYDCQHKKIRYSTCESAELTRKFRRILAYKIGIKNKW